MSSAARSAVASGSAAASRAATASSAARRGGRDQEGERGQQRGVREDGLRQEAGGGLACGRVGVVPGVRGQGAGKPGVDVGLDV
ncbi:hypothetical protein [Streptomyces lavendofoliae]|uniref:hypothetical protein n=1 Tax=Streptomyces lavendofoliae TaxID=67314 RepID=UPI003D9173FB